MAKHKAASQVSIASTEEETAFSDVVKSYGKPALLLALVVSAVILYLDWTKKQAQVATVEGWEELGRDVALDGAGFFSAGITGVSAIAMESFASTQKGSAAAAWAKALEVGQLLREGKEEAANRALGELKQNWPDHILNTLPLFGGQEADSAPGMPLGEHIASRSAALEQWMQENEAIFKPLAMPEDAPKVRFNTSAGSFVVGLRSAEAPLHSANFIRLCSEGFYDNMTFHDVDQDKFISSGSAASKDPELTAEWGQDDNGGSIKPEIGQLWNFPYSLGAARSIDIPSESSDCRFYIVSGDDGHERDREFTVFGMVVEGQETIDKINAADVLGTTPVTPVVIQSTEVL